MAFDGIALDGAWGQPVHTSREEARAAGALYYTAPKLCRRGHAPTVRYVAGGQCVQCHTLKHKEWIERNPGRKQEIDKEYRSRPEIKARCREWQNANRAANPQKRRDYENQRIRNSPEAKRKLREWERAHPEVGRAKQARRRARLKSVLGEGYTAKDLSDLYILQKGRCGWCGIKLRRKYEVDHIFPISKGGMNCRSNILLSCMPCNREKQAKDPLDFVRKKFGKLL